MANYKSGTVRKNSDTKNLIILISSLVLLVAAVIVFVILYNKYWKKTGKSLSDSTYSAYVLSDYIKLLDQEKSSGGNYMIYVYNSESSEDVNLQAVLKYLDKQLKDESVMTLYLLDYSKFDSTSDSTETANADSVEAELGFAISSVGTLIYVSDNAITSKATQVKTDSKKVQAVLKQIQNGGAWE